MEKLEKTRKLFLSIELVNQDRELFLRIKKDVETNFGFNRLSAKQLISHLLNNYNDLLEKNR